MEIAEAMIFAVTIGAIYLGVRYLAQLKDRESAVSRVADQHSLMEVLPWHIPVQCYTDNMRVSN